MRFWDVQKGSVSLSDTSVRQINTRNLRELESFVTQETHLFPTASKTTCGSPAHRHRRRNRGGLQKASVHDFILALPKGYDTPVGELGDTLSGGERQRLGLAKAFLHDAPFLLLDEPHQQSRQLK